MAREVIFAKIFISVIIFILVLPSTLSTLKILTEMPESLIFLTLWMFLFMWKRN